MKKALKKEIQQVIFSLQGSLSQIEGEQDDLFYNLQRIKEDFLTIEMNAARFYLNCYLAPFTDKYEALSAAVQNMALRRHGGLIVVQREDSLHKLVQPGIAIKAELTPALLEAIFYPGNPLHDGAVLISQNDILSAANVLPLSTRKFENQKLGTRHRAAIGLSERSDALVLIVSEESGRVSFAYKGQLYPIAM